MATTATVRADVTGSYTNVLDQGTAAFPFTLSALLSFTDGAGIGQVNRVFADTRTLTGGSAENLDLAGVLTDAFGAVLTFARIKVLAVKSAAANTNNVVLGNHATAAWLGPFGTTAHTIEIKPGGVVIIACVDATGWPVTATTADMLKVLNGSGGTSVTYDIVLLGSAT